jgi:hypothetical protein
MRKTPKKLTAKEKKERKTNIVYDDVLVWVS